MGKGFAILVWDAWGSGLVRINPRLLDVGFDIYGNPNNWFSYTSEDERENKIEELTKNIQHFQIID